jgi:hypothetical protein
MTDIYVGIDPGSKNCAMVAWSPTRGLITTWKPKGTMPTGVLRLRRLMVEITRELEKLEVDNGVIKGVALEDYSHAEKFGQHASGEIGATIKLTILGHFGSDDRRAFPFLIAPGQWKKFASGNGNLKKEMLPKEVLKRWAMDFNDMNIAEAYVLARTAHAVDTRCEMTRFQAEVVDKVEIQTEWVPIPQRRLVRVGR